MAGPQSPFASSGSIKPGKPHEIQVCCRLQSSKAAMREGYRLPENNYSQQAIDFMDKVLEISGLGDYTFLPDGEPTLLLMIAVTHRGCKSPRPDTCGKG